MAIFSQSLAIFTLGYFQQFLAIIDNLHLVILAVGQTGPAWPPAQSRPCLGDDGGPLFWEDPDDFEKGYLVGITSLGGMDCSLEDATMPVVYTYVASIFSWMLKVAGPDIQECTEQDLNRWL